MQLLNTCASKPNPAFLCLTKPRCVVLHEVYDSFLPRGDEEGTEVIEHGERTTELGVGTAKDGDELVSFIGAKPLVQRRILAMRRGFRR